MAERRHLLLFLSNDHRASTSTRRLSNQIGWCRFLESNETAWACIIEARFHGVSQTSTNCTPKSYPFIQAMWWTLSKVLGIITASHGRFATTNAKGDWRYFFQAGEKSTETSAMWFVILDERQGMMTWRTRDSEVMKFHLRVLRHLLHLAFHMNMKIRLLYGVLHSLYNWFGLGGK